MKVRKAASRLWHRLAAHNRRLRDENKKAEEKLEEIERVLDMDSCTCHYSDQLAEREELQCVYCGLYVDEGHKEDCERCIVCKIRLVLESR